MVAVRKSSHSDWRDSFLFVGNDLALDLLNTRPAQGGELVELLPDFPSVLRWFRAAGLVDASVEANLLHKWQKSIRAQQTVEAIVGLRERLRTEILAWEDGGAIHRSIIDELNRLMSVHPTIFRLRSTRGTYLTEIAFKPNEPEDLLAPLAHSAATLFTIDRLRVRKCEHCVLHFRDTSKKGTRRWCSMGLCGNRSKVAAYAGRQRLKTSKRRKG